jgi:lambda family phage tail tape measure protein
MADTSFTVGVETRQAQQALRNLEGSVSSLSASFRTLAGILAGGAFVKFSDSITSVRNKLTLLTDSQTSVQRSFEALSAIAISARTPLEQTADLYFRIARSADQLGISQAEAGQITESVAKAITSSGMSAQEAAGPLLQLGQALQSGRFQGDELRSILEGLPPVSRALADSLGVPVGALKELGSQGKITAEDFVQAMRKSKDAIDRDFARTVPTIGQAFTNLRTNIGLAFNNFEQNSGTAQNFALAVEYLGFTIFKLSSNIDKIVGPLGTFIKIVGTIAAFTVVGRILGAMGAGLTAIVRGAGMAGAVFKNFIEGVKQAPSIFRAVGGGVIGFIETLLLTFRPLGTFLKYLGAVAGAVGTFIGLDKAADWFKSLGDASSESRSELEDYRKELDKFKTQLDTTANPPAQSTSDFEQATRFAKFASDQLLQSQESLQDVYDEIARVNLPTLERAYFDIGVSMRKTAEAAIAAEESQRGKPLSAAEKAKFYEAAWVNANKLYDATLKLNEVETKRRQTLAFDQDKIAKAKELQEILLQTATIGLSEIQRKEYDVMMAARARAEAMIEAEQSTRGAALSAAEIAEYYNQATQGVTELIAAQRELSAAQAEFQLNQFGVKERIDRENELQKIQDNIAKLTLPEIEQKYYDIEAAARASAKAAIEAEEARRGAPLSAEEINRYYAEASKGVDLLIAKTGELYEKSRSFDTGWKQAMNDYVLAATNGADAAKRVFDKTFRGLEDLFINFAKTGKFEWKGFINSILEELVRSELQRTIAGIFGAMRPGSSGGNLFGSIGNFFAGFFANGGQIPSGKFGVVGEKGPELISGPANITPMSQVPTMSAAGVTNVTYNINAVDARSFQQLVAANPEFIYAVTLKGQRSMPGGR